MRFIGIDVHRDFCEMCVLAGDSGEEQRRRVATRPAELEAFARELDRSDVVALETSSAATAVARVLEPYAGRVMLIDPRGLVRAGARAKTDRLDARTLARLLAAGVLTEIWTPDEATRALRRLVARRAAVVRARTRLKNEVHAVLARSLCPRPPRGVQKLSRVQDPVDLQDVPISAPIWRGPDCQGARVVSVLAC